MQIVLWAWGQHVPEWRFFLWYRWTPAGCEQRFGSLRNERTGEVRHELEQLPWEPVRLREGVAVHAQLVTDIMGRKLRERGWF